MSIAPWLIAAAVTVWALALARLIYKLAVVVPSEPVISPQAPWPLRYSQWPVRLMAHYCGRCIKAPWRMRVVGRLHQADLDRAVHPIHWVAYQTWLALTLGALAAALAISLGRAPLPWLLSAMALGWLWPNRWLHSIIARRRDSILRELPGYLDLLTLGLESGSSFNAALQLAVERSPDSPLRIALQRGLQDMRAGRGRIEAMQRLENRLAIPQVSAAIAAIVQADATGASLAPVLRAQAMQRTQERFSRAEKLAMEAPVKMLGPLITCIFPCTFLVVGFPIAAKILWGA